MHVVGIVGVAVFGGVAVVVAGLSGSSSASVPVVLLLPVVVLCPCRPV